MVSSITRYERDECINISPFPFGDGLGSFQNETFRNGINSESHGKFVHSPQLLLLDLSRFALPPFTLMLTSFYASGSFEVATHLLRHPKKVVASYVRHFDRYNYNETF